jgi:Zn-dependent protease
MLLTMLNLDLPTIISRILTLIIAFTIHEFSHAFVATTYGDTTAKDNGRLTLNPLAHLDIMGSILLIVAGFGWAKPVPINPTVLRQKSRFALMWVSLAGPLSNFLLACLAAIPLRFGLVPYTPSGTIFPSLFNLLFDFLVINLLLMVFNLIPLAPLDGEKVIEAFLPGVAGEWFAKIRPYGPMILLVLLFALPRVGVDIVGMYMQPMIKFFLMLLTGGSL